MSTGAVIAFWVREVLYAAVLLPLLFCTFVMGLFVQRNFYSQNNHKPPAKRRLRHGSQGSKRTKAKQKLVAIDILFVCLFHFIIALLANLANFQVISCGTSLRVGGAFYQLGKGLLYTVLIRRIDLVYGGTKYGYPPLLIKVMLASMWSLTLVLTAGHLFWGVSHRRELGGFKSLCVNTVKSWVLILMLFEEITVSIATLHMFTRPLYKLIRERNGTQTVAGTGANEPNVDKEESAGISMRSESQRQTDCEMKRVAQKFTLLTWVAVVTSFVTLLVTGLFSFTGLVAVDILTNAVCVMFMTKWFDDYYPRVCCAPLWFAKEIEICKRL